MSTAWGSERAAVYELVSCVCGFCMKVGFSMLCSLFFKTIGVESDHPLVFCS